MPVYACDNAWSTVTSPMSWFIINFTIQNGEKQRPGLGRSIAFSWHWPIPTIDVHFGWLQRLHRTYSSTCSFRCPYCWLDVYIYIYTYVTYFYAYTYIYICNIFLCKYVYMYIYICIYIYICMYRYDSFLLCVGYILDPANISSIPLELQFWWLYNVVYITISIIS